MKMEDALDFIGEEAFRQGAQQFDMVGGQSESVGVSVFEGQVKNTEISSSRGLGIRLFKDGCPGYAFTELLNKNALVQTVKDAVEHAELTDPLDVDLPKEDNASDLDLKLWTEDVEKIGTEELTQLALELESNALAGDSRIVNVPYLGAGKGSSKSWFRNHYGLSFENKSNSVSAGLGAVAMAEGVSKMGVCSRERGALQDLDSKVMAALSVERAVELLGAGKMDSGEIPVVFSNRVAPQILGMFRSPFIADSVQKGQSRFEGKLGKTVASSCVNIVSDPFIPGFNGSMLHDGEGVTAQKLQIIEDGVLQNFLHNLESAKKDGVASTGNASRSYSGRAGTSFANFVLSPGEKSLEELLAIPKRCLLVVKLEGGSGCSSVSGQISIGAQGFLVEDGKIIRPVDGLTLSGNFFDLLQNIQEVGSTCDDNRSSMRVPDFLVNGISVAS